MDKAELMNAVKALRAALSDSQQAFAQRMGTAIRTVARWETVRPPSGSSLADLEGLAGATGHVELQSVFRRAIADELGTWDASESNLDLEPRTDTEKLYVAALLATLRNPEYRDQHVKLIPLLRKQAEVCIQILEEHRLAARTQREAMRLLEAGVDPAIIAKDLNVSEADLRRFGVVSQMRRSIEQANKWAAERAAKESK